MLFGDLRNEFLNGCIVFNEISLKSNFKTQLAHLHKLTGVVVRAPSSL